MKRVIYALIVPLVVASGLVFANREIKNENVEKPAPKPLSAAEAKTEAIKQWESTPAASLTKNGRRLPKVKKC